MFIDVWVTGPQISDESQNEEFNVVEDEDIHTLADIKARTEEMSQWYAVFRRTS